MGCHPLRCTVADVLGNVLNTELRFAAKFVRHKILDIIGDLYLLGFPIRGKVTARLTGHRDNIELLKEIQRQSGS